MSSSAPARWPTVDVVRRRDLPDYVLARRELAECVGGPAAPRSIRDRRRRTDLPLKSRPRSAGWGSLEGAYLRDLLDRHDGNISAAAKAAGDRPQDVPPPGVQAPDPLTPPAPHSHDGGDPAHPCARRHGVRPGSRGLLHHPHHRLDPVPVGSARHRDQPSGGRGAASAGRRRASWAPACDGGRRGILRQPPG